MHCLLLGNGINRLSLQLSWAEVLERLVDELQLNGIAKLVEQKPLSLLFEELCAHSQGEFRQVERMVKGKIAALLTQVPPDPLHIAFSNLFDVMLTTNYDYTLEHAMVGPLYEHSPIMRESRYSLFRRVQTGFKEVWHIHGALDATESILLGYDQYAGYLQKIRNYLTDGLKPDNKADPLRSPLKSGKHDIELREVTHSWVDYFLKSHLHLVGIGLDFTEIDLWWLLLHKRRRRIQTGLTFYYQIIIAGEQQSGLIARLSLLESLGIRVACVEVKTYRDGYERIVEIITRNIAAHPKLFAYVPSNAKMEINETRTLQSGRRNRSDRQIKLSLKQKLE